MIAPEDTPIPLIGIVGPCGSGKSTLASLLIANGYWARAIAQEHSFVPTMWKKITNPDYLVYLISSYETSTTRKKLDWKLSEYQEQLRRLENSHQSAQLIIETDNLTPDQILNRVISYLPNP